MGIENTEWFVFVERFRYGRAASHRYLETLWAVGHEIPNSLYARTWFIIGTRRGNLCTYIYIVYYGYPYADVLYEYEKKSVGKKRRNQHDRRRQSTRKRARSRNLKTVSYFLNTRERDEPISTISPTSYKYYPNN